MIRYKLAVFDLDGTILDTLDDLADAVNFALRTCDFPTRSREEVRSMVGNGIRNLISRAVPEGTDADLTENVFQAFKKHYAAHCADRTRPYDGVGSLIEELKRQGMKTAVLSNKADFAVQDLMRRYFPGQFDLAAGELEGIKRKPDPEALQNILKQLGCTPQECVYIGDSEVDIKTASNAEMDGIIVTWGFRKKADLQAAGASVLCDTMEELQAQLLSDDVQL